MHDKHGRALHPGDKVRHTDGTEFHVHGYLVQQPGAPAHKGTVAFAHDVELVAQRADNAVKDPIAGDCIIWGNGKPPIE